MVLCFNKKMLCHFFSGVCQMLINCTAATCMGVCRITAAHFDTKRFHHCFHSRPNVCVEREVTLVAQRQPCVQAFTRMVKVWKQGCVGQTWCMGYERR